MTHNITRLKSGILSTLITVFFCSCSSPPPIEANNNSPAKPVPHSSVLEEVKEGDLAKNELMETTQDPKYAQLMQLLASLGYEGVGLQFESPPKLDLLLQVFSNPKAAYRNLRLIYTGTQWNYDLKHQSLTVGEGKNAGEVLTYIEKNIKLKPLPQRKPIARPQPVVTPPATVFPKKLPVDVREKLQKPVPEPPAQPAVEPVPTPSLTPVPESEPSHPVVPEEKLSPFERDAPVETPVTSPSTLEENQPIKEE